MDLSPWIPYKTVLSDVLPMLPCGCKAFGSGSSIDKIDRWLEHWSYGIKSFDCLLVIAGSLTAAVEGISAAGATSDSRRYTAVADAELLLKGPLKSRRWSLPPLSAGVSPALISFVAARSLGIEPLVLAVGLSQSPPFPHIRFDLPSRGPAQCVSTGCAMKRERVELLWEKGILMGRKVKRPIMIGECVPGGTTTAQAVLTGLGLSVSDLISGSVRNPPLKLKKDLVEKGLSVAGLGINPTPKDLIAAVGDPFQPVAAGVLIGARQIGQQVLLGGGSQMLAILALALESLAPSARPNFIEGVVIGTTSWLAEEGNSSKKYRSQFVELMDLIGEHFGVGLFGICSGLRFNASSHRALRDYELGYVKEGVGAGALSLLAQLNGCKRKELVRKCEEAIEDLYR